jgi:hypothetical protein
VKSVNTNILMKRFAAILGSALIGTMLATASYAATEPVVAQVTFADPIAITQNNALQYGVIDHVLNAEVITIAPDSSLSGDGVPLILGGTQAAANLTIDAEALQVLSIQVGTIIDGTGYALSAFTCKYNGGSDTACQAAPHIPTAVASAILLIGATLTGDNLATPGPANGSFIVTVTYQ